MKTITVAALALMAAIAGAAPASAADYRAGDIVISEPWARATATPQARTGAAYMALSNKGDTVDRLTGASTPVAERAELHTHEMDGNVMRMRPIEGVEIAPGEPAVLRPGGLHLMLVGLRQPLRAGDRVPLTLTFQRGGTVEVEVAVGPVAGMASPGAPHTH